MPARTHGMVNSPEYTAYINARARCNDPKRKGYQNYGGRGIKFLFTSFEQWFAELGLRPTGMTVDRKNNDGNYEPGNVHWATREEQRANARSPKPFKRRPASAKTRAKISAAAFVREAGFRKLIEESR